MKITRCIKLVGGYSLLSSLCMHAVAFILLGIIVLGNAERYGESVNVELVKVSHQTKKLRRNIPRPHKQILVDTAPAKNPPTTSNLLVSQTPVPFSLTSETFPVFQCEPADIELSDLLPQKPKINFSPPVPRAKTLLPITRSQQVKPFEIPSQLLKLSEIHSLMASPTYKVSDPKILQDFLQVVRKKIERSKRYPKHAIEMGLEGKVIVRFTILRDGTLDKNIQIVSSSGAEVLDEAAVTAVKDASPFPALPQELGRDYIQIELPMHFRLGEL